MNTHHDSQKPPANMALNDRAMSAYNVDTFRDTEYPMLKGEMVFAITSIQVYKH